MYVNDQLFARNLLYKEQNSWDTYNLNPYQIINLTSYLEILRDEALYLLEVTVSFNIANWAFQNTFNQVRKWLHHSNKLRIQEKMYFDGICGNQASFFPQFLNAIDDLSGSSFILWDTKIAAIREADSNP